MKRKILEWLLTKYAFEQKKELDQKYKEEFKALKRLFDGRSIREVLFEMMFPHDIMEPVNLHERYRIYSKLNADKDFIKLFKSKYSKNYFAHIQAANDEQRGLVKGRMLELQDTLMTAAIAPSKLQNWKEVEKIQDKKITLKKDIQKELLTND